MSIASEINRIKNAKASLKSAINAKGGNLRNERLEDYAGAVAGLYSGPDLSGVTVTADKMLKGVVAVDSDGREITGTIPEVTASSDGETVTIPAGYHKNKKSFSVNREVDLSFVTAGAGDILAGKTGIDADGNPVEGTIEKVSMQVVENVITMPPGYTEGENVTLPELTVTNNQGTIKVSTGYNKIMRIFNVTGGEGTTFYKCTSVNTSTKTWAGKRVILSNGEYSFESNVTGNLSFTTAVPEVDQIYTENALARIQLLSVGMSDAHAYASFNYTWDMVINQQTVTLEPGINGSLYFSKGMTQSYALTFDGSSYLDMQGMETDLFWGDFTIELGVSMIGPERRMAVLATDSDYFIGIDIKDGKYNLWVGDGSSWSIHADWDCGESYGGGSVQVKNATAQHLAITRKGTSWKLYVDGKLSVDATSDVVIGLDARIRLGRWGNGEYSAYGKMEKYNMYMEALDASQVNSIAQAYISSRTDGSCSFSVLNKDTHVLTNGQGSQIFKQYDGFALVGILDVTSPVFMTGVIMVSEDDHSCLWYGSSIGSGSAVSFEYNGKTWYYSTYYADLGTPKNMMSWPYLDAVGAEAAAKELIARYNGTYSRDFDEECNLFVYRAGIAGVNGKYCLDAAFGSESVYRNGSYYMKKREYGGYWVICSDSDPDMPLYAACKYDENTGEYVPTENILGPWISMMGSQPPPRVLEGDLGAFGL